LNIKQGLEFDDVLIKPIPSNVSSRDDVDISVKLSDFLTLKFPLIASPMVGVVDGAFANKLSDLGGLAILHRFYKNYQALCDDINDSINVNANFGISLKLDDKNYEELLFTYQPKILLVDVANGYIDRLANYCESIKNCICERGYKTLLMAGNVATLRGCLKLHNAGCDIIRVGIGNGSPCSTRNHTGIGVPTITALQECDNNDVRKYTIVADGGIRNAGDFVKAIVSGADLGMAGRLFAECYEAPNDDEYYGMASRTHIERTKKTIKSIEGFAIKINKKHSLKTFVEEFGYGIKSAGTYLNAKSLEQIYFNGEFILTGRGSIKNL